MRSVQICKSTNSTVPSGIRRRTSHVLHFQTRPQAWEPYYLPTEQRFSYMLEKDQKVKKLVKDLLSQADRQNHDTLQNNIIALTGITSGAAALFLRTIQQHGSLLGEPNSMQWFEFLVSYGVSNEAILKLLSDFPDVLSGNIYTAGQAILFFKGWGYKDKDIRDRIVGYYPYLLAKSVSRDLQPVVDQLQQAGCTGRQLELLVWEYPRIFHKDYRRLIRQFAFMEVYGLSLSRLTPELKESQYRPSTRIRPYQG